MARTPWLIRPLRGIVHFNEFNLCAGLLCDLRLWVNAWG
jgi:hypothetical protein